MRNIRILLLISVIIFFLLFSTGCMVKRLADEPIEVDIMPLPQKTIVMDSGTPDMAQRFTEPEADVTDAVESALMWSQKYEELLVKAETLKGKNDEYQKENSELKQQYIKLQAELERTKAELADANEFLQQMHQELGKWKTDVIGFRDEIRSAQAAQLTALTKILKILGAELVETDTMVSKAGN